MVPTLDGLHYQNNKRKGVFIMAIRIVLNTGEEIVGEVGSYDALELAKQLNNNQIMFITIGDYILHKQSIKMIIPVTSGGE